MRKPSTDGAYIALSSHGAEAFINGYIYVSYEDFFIESELYTIAEAREVYYDEIYQHDFYGGIFSIGTGVVDTGYYANIYQRNTAKKEALTHVGITVTDYSDVEIFVNPSGNMVSLNSLVKIGESNGNLEPGYHTIAVNETELTGTSFALVIKQKAERFYFAIEANVPNTVYGFVDSEAGQSLISLDGYAWDSLAQIDVDGLDMSKSDVCIKAFTKYSEEINEGILVDPYKIEDEYIIRIPHGTTINSFLQNIRTELRKNNINK